MRLILCAAAVMVLVCVCGLAAAGDGNAASPSGGNSAGDWPKWCGPRGDCTTHEKGLLESWPEAGPKELWRRPVGLGYAAPVAVDGKVYVFGTIDGKDTLTCLSAGDGNILWSRRSAVGWTGGHPGTRAAPTIEDGRIYTFGGMSDLLCRNLADGNEIWSLDVMKATGGRAPMWGSASSPTVVGDLVYVQIGGPGKGGPEVPIAIAVNKKSGTIVWQSEEKGLGSYATVVPAEIGGARQMLVFGGREVVGMDPNSGKTLWKCPWITQYDINAVSPVYRDGCMFITSGYNRGCSMLKWDGNGMEKLWEKKEPHDRMVPPLLEGDYLYVASEGSLMCLHWPDGNEAWPKVDLKLGIGGQYVRAGDEFIMLSDAGMLLLVKATPRECKVVSKVQVFTDPAKEIWTSPLVYRGRLYVKGTSDLVCFDISGK